MTYIVGMITDEGVLLSADGLARMYDRDSEKWLPSRTDAVKVFQVTDYICVAVAGAVYEFNDFMNTYRSTYIQPFLAHPDQPKTVLDVAKHFSSAVSIQFEEAARHRGLDFDILIAGYDTTDNTPGSEPQLYCYRHNVNTSKKSLFSVNGMHDGGYTLDVHGQIVPRYFSGGKDYNRLRKLSIEAMRKSNSLYPKDVGGQILAFYVTQNGVKKLRSVTC